MNKINIALFADNEVGSKICTFILDQYPSHAKFIVINENNTNLFNNLVNVGYNKDSILFSNQIYDRKYIEKLKESKLDFIILAWWPYIIKKPILSIPKYGIINFHPSLLPYNRGKHTSFWTIVEDVPFGVSLHFIDESIDSGDILFQEKINKSWEDTGESLYCKAKEKIVDLFIENYPKIIKKDFKSINQEKSKATFHYSNEIDSRSEIILDKKYKARELLNLLRARTFKPFPGCFFYDNGNKYEIRIEINKIN